MKKIVASVGLIAVGVSGAYAAYAPGLSTMDTSKSWGVAASLRGFYDDNYGCVSVNEQESFGFEISPMVKFNLPLDQTYLGLRYIYSGRYYADRADDVPGFSNDPWDQTHQADFILNHAFNERYSLDVQDSFIIGQEPSLMAADSQGNAYPFRADGNNVRNQGRATFNAQLTRVMGLQIGYNNVLWDYEDDNGAWFDPSLSGLMDRMEHLALVNLHWQVKPETTALLGYNFGAVGYSSSEQIGFLPGYGLVYSDDRNNTSHYIYGGVNHDFLRNFTASLKVGATYVDYDNDMVNSDSWMPYGDASLSYTYATGSYVQAGVLYTFNSTDVVAPSAADQSITSAQDSLSLYALVNHQFTARLAGLLRAHYQNSAFQGGSYDGDADNYFSLGANLTYMISRHISCEAGYTYDNLDSDVPSRGYVRNRVYVGVTASY